MLRVVAIPAQRRKDVRGKVLKADKIMARVLSRADQADQFLGTLRLQTNEKDLMAWVKFAVTWLHYKRY
jgi:hypothetical protein